MSDVTTPTLNAARRTNPTLVRVLALAGAEWFVLNFFALLCLDYGRLSKITSVATLGYVLGAALFVARRGGQKPTRVQRAILLWCPVPLLIATYLMAMRLVRP